MTPTEAIAELTAFVEHIARMTKDGEVTPDHPDGWDMPSDDAVDTVNSLITEARDLRERLKSLEQRRNTVHNILILPSMDGVEYTRAILYPAEWTPEQADTAAIAAFKAAQAKNPDEWNWDDYEPELTARGFLIPCWHHGPIWDERV